MPLKIALRPNEKMIIDGAVVRNGSTACNLYIENEVPILREKDIMTENMADSPCRKIYFVIQLMYIDRENLARYHKQYWKLVRELIQAAPRFVDVIDAISEYIISNQYYKALKLGTKLIAHEEEVLSNVRKSIANL